MGPFWRADRVVILPTSNILYKVWSSFTQQSQWEEWISDTHGVEPQPCHMLTWDLNKVILSEFQSVLFYRAVRSGHLLCCSEKVPHNLRERLCFSHSFRGFSLPRLGGCGRGKQLIPWQPRSRKKNIQEGVRTRHSPMSMPLKGCSLQRDHTLKTSRNNP